MLKDFKDIDLNKDYMELSDYSRKKLRELELTKKMTGNIALKLKFMEEEVNHLRYAGLTLDNIFKWSGYSIKE